MEEVSFPVPPDTLTSPSSQSQLAMAEVACRALFLALALGSLGIDISLLIKSPSSQSEHRIIFVLYLAFLGLSIVTNVVLAVLAIVRAGRIPDSIWQCGIVSLVELAFLCGFRFCLENPRIIGALKTKISPTMTVQETQPEHSASTVDFSSGRPSVDGARDEPGTTSSTALDIDPAFDLEDSSSASSFCRTLDGTLIR